MNKNPDSEDQDFATFLAEFGHGATNTRATEYLRALVKACAETGRKGTLTLKIDVAAASGLAELKASITVKAPQPSLPGGAFYTTEEGELLHEDPRQLKLPTKVLDTKPLKTIPFTAPTATDKDNKPS